MPVTPENATASANGAETRRSRFRRRLWMACFAIFAFEIGAFLVAFPWMDAWSLNHLPSLFPRIQNDLMDLWDDSFFKGAVSALGLLNVYIAFRQVIGMTRPTRST
jgi:hypothetical protein